MNKIKQWIENHSTEVLVGTAFIGGFTIGCIAGFGGGKSAMLKEAADIFKKEIGDKIDHACDALINEGFDLRGRLEAGTEHIGMVFGDAIAKQDIWDEHGRCVSIIEDIPGDIPELVVKQAVHNMQEKFPDCVGFENLNIIIETVPD